MDTKSPELVLRAANRHTLGQIAIHDRAGGAVYGVDAFQHSGADNRRTERCENEGDDDFDGKRRTTCASMAPPSSWGP